MEMREDDLVNCPKGTKRHDHEGGRFSGFSYMDEDRQWFSLGQVDCPEGTKQAI